MKPEPSIEPVVRDPLAVALMPVLLHRVNNATQVLTSLNALLSIDDRGAVLESRAGDLAYASAAIDDLGWMLALLASACGADALLERRHAQGLISVLASVREALRREGRDLEGALELPDLEPGVADGWQLPWAFGSWLWSCARASPEQRALAWDLDLHEGTWTLVCSAPLTAEVEAVTRSIATRLPASVFDFGGSRLRWNFPSGWLRHGERER